MLGQHLILRSVDFWPDMFLFARLVLDNLRDQPDQDSLLAEIDKDVFPNDLSQA
jgi:hypothetical protein